MYGIQTNSRFEIFKSGFDTNINSAGGHSIAPKTTSANAASASP